MSSIKRGTKATLLSSYINELKSKSIDYKIKWSIIGRTRGLRNGDESCRLCVKEATAITFADNSCINKKNEIANTCRHKKFFLLKFNYKPG